MQPALSLVTLGVTDLSRSITFYESLGFVRKVRAAGGVGFFQVGAMAFAVWQAADLAEDARAAVNESATGFRGVSLSWNCPSESDVDAVFALAERAGARIAKPPQAAPWGGYAGYFADPDGHLWEVAYNPGFPLSDDGRLTLPA